jgi:hypothetical protein
VTLTLVRVMVMAPTRNRSRWLLRALSRLLLHLQHLPLPRLLQRLLRPLLCLPLRLPLCLRLLPRLRHTGLQTTSRLSWSPSMFDAHTPSIDELDTVCTGSTHNAVFNFFKHNQNLK